jgi:hypothetical protein
MRKLFLSTLVALSVFAISIQAQSYRLQTLSDQLQRNTSDLAERTYNDFTRSSNNSRSDVDTLLIAQQLNASADIFKRMVQDRRPNSELRDITNALSDLARRAPYSSSNNYYWRDTQKTIDDISREVGSGGGWNGGNNNGNNNDRDKVIGNLNWKGTVDDEVQLVIRGNSVEIKTISGQTYSNANYNFTSPLPNRKVNVEVDKKKGRGKVRILQQPNRDNDFTTVIQIQDKDGGAKDYELEIYWR